MAKKKNNKKKISPVTNETNRLLFNVAVILMIIFFVGLIIAGLS